MTHLDPHRSYRLGGAASEGEIHFQVVVEQTDLLVVAGRDLSREVRDVVVELRGQLSAYMLLNPEFRHSLAPVAARAGAPEIVRRMAEAAAAVGVGPMAAVAGTIAELVALELRGLSPDILVENGGDVFMCSTKDRVVGLLADPANNLHLGLRIPASEFPVSLCGSSATIGHSKSFGHSDLLVVRSRSGSMADAAATALANRLHTAADLEAVMRHAGKLEKLGVQGVFAQCGGSLAAWGQLELVALGDDDG